MEKQLVVNFCELFFLNILELRRDHNFCKDETEDDLKLTMENPIHGTHETQVSEGGEADLHKHYNSCKKNPGHKQFVPVNDFTINHLPESYHDNDLFEFIKATADLTVRVSVDVTSAQRPELWPDRDVPFPFYDKIGSNVMRLGTGMVSRVKKLTKKNDSTCTCQKCQHSDSPSKVWWNLCIQTAKHVVFDDFEANNTTCRLFFDRPDSPLVILNEWEMYSSSIESDFCVLLCNICDVNLLDKLETIWKYWCDLIVKVNNKYRGIADVPKLLFLASHPHGCPKMISVGHSIDRIVLMDYFSNDADTMYTYTTSTCPGSSGAHVYSLGYYDDWFYGRHVHSGVNNHGKNYCGIGWDIQNL